MLTLNPPNYQFCPFDGTGLATRQEENEDRRYCPQCKWTYYPRMATSTGALILKEGKVLLVQRARDPYKGTWMMPSGFINYGEHPEEAVRREVEEETGYTVDQVSFYELQQAIDDPREPGHFYFVYNVTLTQEPPVDIPDKEENTAIEWFDINDLPEIGWQRHQKILTALAEDLEALSSPNYRKHIAKARVEKKTYTSKEVKKMLDL